MCQSRTRRKITEFAAAAATWCLILHRSALHGVSSQNTGIAAGLYGMTRYGGSMLGTAVAGILLRWGLAGGLSTIAAYQRVFWILTGICVMGILLGLRLRK